MKGENLLLKLTPKGIEIGKPFGGSAQISSMDVAGALAGISNPAYLYAEVVFLGDTTKNMQEALILYTRHLASRIAQAENWKVDDIKLDICAHLAVIEHKHPGKCKTCNGSGEILTAKVAKVCPSCNGVGSKRMTNAQLGRALGVSKDAARKTWQYRYEQIYLALYDYEQEIARHLYKQFYTEVA